MIRSTGQAGYTPQTFICATPGRNSLDSKLHRQPFIQVAISRLGLLKHVWQQHQKRSQKPFPSFLLSFSETISHQLLIPCSTADPDAQATSVFQDQVY